MNTDEAIYRAMTGGKGSGSAATVAQQVGIVMKAVGGSPKAGAQLTGIPERTWRYLRSGQRQPSSANRSKLESAVRHLRVSATRQKFLRRRGPHGPKVVVSAEVQISSDVRDRKLYISRWPRVPNRPDIDQVDGITGRMLDAWLRADDYAAQAALIRPISAGVGGQGVTLNRVFAIRVFKTDSEARRYSSIAISKE